MKELTRIISYSRLTIHPADYKNKKAKSDKPPEIPYIFISSDLPSQDPETGFRTFKSVTALTGRNKIFRLIDIPDTSLV